MATALQQLAEFVRDATTEFRHGEEVSQHSVGNVNVVEVYAMPPKSEAESNAIDVGFMMIGFTNAADGDKDRFVVLLKDALAGPGEFVDLLVSEFLSSQSYINLGGWIGSQDLALRLIALLEHYELGEVMLPRKVGITGEMEQQMMGVGFVYGVPNHALRELLVND